MRTTSIVVTALIALLFTAPGCGKKGDYQPRLTKLQEDHRKEIAGLEAKYTAQIEGYKQQLVDREKELLAKSGELAEAKRQLSEQRMLPVTSAAVPEQKQKAKAAAEKPAAQTEGASDAAQPEPPPMAKGLSLLEQFTLEYEKGIEEGRKESYRKDLGSFLAMLRAQAQNEPAPQRKDKMLGELRKKIETETDEDEREEIENRMEKIQSASAEDLEGVLNYYQQLDNNADLGRLMEEYNISRDELRDYGITPPPRTRWGPEIKEVTTNLNAFVEDYEPLVPEEQREQYRKDFNDAISNILKRPTDEQVLQRKNQMLTDLQARYSAADEHRKYRIQRRIERLESRDLDSLRRMVQMEKARELRNITEKYGIPRSELYQSGVRIPRWRRR
jgi:hypothetical protein